MYIRATTWNAGMGFPDFLGQLAALGNEREVPFQELEQKLFLENLTEAQKKGKVSEEDQWKLKVKAQKEIHDPIERAVAEKVAANSDVIFLQEIRDPNRVACEVFRKKGFTIIHVQDGDVDNAIAIRTKMFSDVVNLSAKSSTQVKDAHGRPFLYGQDIAGVSVLHTKSGRRFNLASVHSWGFKLYKPGTEEQQKKYNDSDKANMKYANTYMRDAIKLVNQTAADGIIIGGDMNDDLINDPKPGPETFGMMKTEGFDVVGPKGRTHVFLDMYRDRKLDYFFTKFNNKSAPKSLCQRILAFVLSIFFSKNEISLTPPIFTKPDICITDDEFEFGENFSSDHLPVLLQVEFFTPSVISRVCAAVRRYFRCC